MAETTIRVEGNVTGSEAPVPEVAEDRPEWLPEKFKSPEELSKAYGELENNSLRAVKKLIKVILQSLNQKLQRMLDRL